MNRTLKKWLKGISISLISLLLLVFIAVGITINYVVTPQKLTPIINSITNDYLKTDLQFGSVDITLLGNFPNIGITLKDGQITSSEKIDTTINGNLISFSKIDIWVNPWAYLSDKKIDIDKIEIISPKIYTYISETGKQNWDILKSTTDVDSIAVESSEDDSTNFTFSQINLRGFVIKDANLIYDNREASLYARVKKYNFSLKGDIGEKSAKLKLLTSLDKALFWRDGELLVSGLDLRLEADIKGNPNKKEMILESGKLSLNNIELNAEGTVGVDSINVNVSIKSGDIQKIINNIPSSIITSKDRYKTSGGIIVDANIAGELRDGKLPIIKGMLSMDGISIHHDDVKYGIDDISANVKYHIDVNERHKSSIDIEYFKAKASRSEIDISTKIRNIFVNPTMELSGKMNINLTEISELIPFNDSLHFDGKVFFDGFVSLDMNNIKRGDYAKIPANAKLNLDSVNIIMPFQDIDISINNINADLSNSKRGYLDVKAEINDSKIKFKNKIDAYISTTYASWSGIAQTDSTSVLKGKIGSNGVDIEMPSDSLSFKTAMFELDFSLSKDKKELNLATDSIMIQLHNNKFFLSKSRFELYSVNRSLTGEVEFNDLMAHVDGLNLPIVMQKTTMQIASPRIKLTDAKFIVGDSDFTLTGDVDNIIKAMQGKGIMRINSLLKSKFIDINQLTAIYNPNIESKKLPENLEGDTTLSVFVIPKNMDVQFDMDIDSLKFEDLIIYDMRGHLNMDSTSLVLSSIGLNAVDAELKSALEYRAIDDKGAYSRFVLSAEEIPINDVIKLLPTIDTILPMIKSLSGIVSLNITADTKFDSLMNIDLNTFSGAINISGKDVELLDGEVFAKIAKMLYFKKKGSNRVDEMSVDFIIDSGRVEVLPFKLNINRYSLAVGGEHFLDNTFNYHISILKSPIPFKMGVNVSGNIDDMKIRFGKARYKRENAPTEIGTVNPIYLKKWNKISDGLQWK